MLIALRVVAGHNENTLYFQLIYQICVLLGWLYELNPSAELVADEGIVAEHCVTSVSLFERAL